MLMVDPVEPFAISWMGIKVLGCILIDGVVVVIGCVTTTVCTNTGDSEIDRIYFTEVLQMRTHNI